MEDGGSPYFWAVVVLGITTVVLLAIVIFLVVNFRKNIVRLMKKKVHGELPGDFDDVTEEDLATIYQLSNANPRDLWSIFDSLFG